MDHLDCQAMHAAKVARFRAVTSRLRDEDHQGLFQLRDGQNNVVLGFKFDTTPPHGSSAISKKSLRQNFVSVPIECAERGEMKTSYYHKEVTRGRP